MFKFNKITREEFMVVIKNTAQKMGINDVTVEKDYWLCFILNYLFNKCEYKDSFVFKGGTSLSKCFGIINRFSEDADLILDWRVIGYDVKEPWKERSNTKQDKFNKEANLKTEEFLKEKLLNILINDLEELISDDFELCLDEGCQTILFRYPKVFESNYLLESIRLEIGTLAAWTPSEKAWIKPYTSEYYSKLFDGESIELNTVSVARTFWEKATILHHEANRPNNLKIPNRYARHYYDMYKIANSKYKKNAFEELHLLKKVADFKSKFYPRKWARYEDATIEKIRIVPDEYRFNEIKKDYNSMNEMFFKESPSFEELINGLKLLENEIRKIK